VPLPNFLAALKSFPEEFQRIAHGTCYAMAGFSDRGGPSLPMISSVDTCAPLNIVDCLTVALALSTHGHPDKLSM
jgi:hypothetical protein